MKNIPFSENEVNQADATIGQCKACLQGKCTSKRTNNVSNPEVSEIGEIVACDLMFIENQPYFVAVDLHSGTKSSKPMSSKHGSSIAEALVELSKVYQRHHHRVRLVYSDQESGIKSKIVDDITAELGIVISNTCTRQHVASVERAIRTIKERVNTIINSLPYQLPVALYRHLVDFVVSCINLIPKENAIDSPYHLFTGFGINYDNIPNIEFGAVVIAKSKHAGKHPISLPNGDLCLCVGRTNLTPKSIRVVPLNDHEAPPVNNEHVTAVKDFEDAISLFGKNSSFAPSSPMQVSEGREEDDDTDVVTDHPIVSVYSNTSVVSEASTGVSNVVVSEITPIPHSSSSRDPGPEFSQDSSSVTSDDVLPVETLVDNNSHSIDDDISDIVEQHLPSHNYNLRNRQNYKHISWKDVHVNVMSIKDAKKSYGDLATSAVNAELQQMLEYNVFEPSKESVRSIPSSLFLKEKMVHGQLDKLKARLVAGGHREECPFMVDRYAPTINNTTYNVMFSTCATLDYEMVIWDVRSAYLNVKLDSDIHMSLNQELTSNLVVFKPEWKKFIRPNGCMIVKLLKALYGTKEAANLWYEDLKGTLMNKCGLKQSAIDPCLFMNIDGKKRTYVGIHADDLLTCGNDKEFIKRLKKILTDAYKFLTEKSGNELEYLGLAIKRNRKLKRIDVDQIQYIKQMLKDYRINDSVVSPSVKYDTRGSEELGEADITKFKSLVMKLMYVALRTRPDIAFSVTYLTTKLVTPTVADLKAARRVLSYLRGTLEKVKTYDYNDYPNLHCYIDASFGIYSDGRSHTGVSIYLGNGSSPILWKSKKQTCRAKSSTEAELLAVYDSIPYTDHISGILREFGLKPKILWYQDNKSAISVIESPSRVSAAMEHLRVKINVVKDFFKDNRVIIDHCDTCDMIADVLTKPLNGKAFVQLRGAMLGDYDQDKYPDSYPPIERVC